MCKRFLSVMLTVFFLCFLLPFSVIADDEINLAKNQTCIVEIGEPVSFSYGLLTDGDEPFETNNGRLTDENIATDDADSNAWYRAYRGGKRIVRFDFLNQVSVSGIAAGFLFDSSLNICPPRYVRVYLSDDGINYGLASEYNATYPLPYVSPQRCEIALDFEQSFSARFVNIEFSCDNYVYCDEISVFGSDILSGGEAKVEIDETEKPKAEYPLDISGAKDIIRLKAGGFSKLEAKAYIGYLNTNGEIAGRMFDSVCLMPSQNHNFSNVADWDFYMSELVSSFGTLQSVSSEVYSAINFEDKLKIFVALPYPPVNDNDAESRLNTMKAFVDKCLAHFSETEYENIGFCGFFWSENEINFNASDHEAELLKSINGYIGDLGVVSVFESGYLAAGYDIWQDLGFDCALMNSDCSKSVSDSSYYFDIRMLSQFAQSAKNNSMGVAIGLENVLIFGSDAFQKAGKNFESHLYYGYKNGYMNGVTIFCGCDGVFEYLCNADINSPKGIYLRRLYDLTYNFIHRTYENLAPQIEVQTSYEFHSGDRGINIEIDIIDGDSYWNDITVEFSILPAHGDVVASSNKKELIYNVEEGFTGEDSFTVRVTDGFGYSQEKTVSVLVKDPQPIEPPDNSEGTQDSQIEENSDNSVSQSEKPSSNKKSPLFWVILGVSLAFGIAIVVGIGVLIRRKHN